MKPLTLKTVLFVLLSAVLFSCAKEDDGVYFSDTNQLLKNEVLNADAVTYTAFETEILDLVNNHRKNLGLNALGKLNMVSSVSKGHTDYMVETGDVSHYNFNVRAQALIDNAGAKSVGETVAYGFSSAQGVVNGWINSDQHRAILEKPDYTHFGISVKANIEGRNYFTQMFIKK